MQCRYFTWILRSRDGTWHADGRGNSPYPGRHSLGTKDREEAITNLKRLDLVRATELELADPKLLGPIQPDALTIEDGVSLYLEHAKRPRLAGGPKETTYKRYRAVHDKWKPFIATRGVTHWNQVTKEHLLAYASWLDGEGYAYRTEFLEATTVKQTVNFLISEGRLSADRKIILKLRKPKGTDTYCYRKEEVASMIAQCEADSKLLWLHDVIVALACTGMRISELAGLRPRDIDFASGTITLRDETARRQHKDETRTTKSGRNRSFPIHSRLLPILTERCSKTDRTTLFRGPENGALRPDGVRNALIKHVLVPLSKRFPSGEDEIGFKDGRLHSFRHYFCSACANSGVPVNMVMEWLGHASSDMVRHYYHLHNDEAQRHMARLDFLGDSAESAG
jgi:integrase